MSRTLKTLVSFPAVLALLGILVLDVRPSSAAEEDTDSLALPVRKEGKSSKSSAPSTEKNGSRKTSTTSKEQSAPKSKEAASSKDKAESAPTKSSEKKSTTKKTTAAKPSTKSTDSAGDKKQASKSSKRTSDDDEDAVAASLPVRKSRTTGTKTTSDEKRGNESADVASLTPNMYLDDAAPPASASRSGEVNLPTPLLNRNQTQSLPVQTAALPPPAPQEPKSGFLARLLGRGSRSSSTAAAPVPFNTDYATRAAGTVIPAMLTGMGWGGVDLPIGSEDQYRLATLPTDFRPTDLVLIPKEYSCYGNPIYLRREAATTMMRMFDDAARQGHPLRIFSGYRDYSHQQRLYQQAVKRHGENQKGVARPGKSEHQLGTTADVTDGPRSVLTRSFADTPSGKWLAANCARYGWKMTVLRGNGPRSHADEPWHIRYLTTSNVNVASTGGQQAPPRRVSLVRGLGRLIGMGRSSQQ